MFRKGKLLSKFFLGLIFIGIFSVLGCVTYIPKASIDEMDPIKKGYIYGNFELTQVKLISNIGLDIKNVETGKISSIAFTKNSTDNIQLLVLNPGTYKIENWFVIGSGGDRGKKGVLYTDYVKLNESFSIEEGIAIYIGDYKGISKSERLEGNMVLQTTEITEINDLFEKTSIEVNKKYPFFSSLKTLNLLK